MNLSLPSTPLSYVDSLRTGPSARDLSRLTDQQLFSTALSRAREEDSTDPAQQARRAAEDFVAQALVEPVLKQMREMSNAEAPFAPNQAEKAFRTMFDNALAQRIVKSGNWALVGKVTDRILHRAGVSRAVPTEPRP